MPTPARGQGSSDVYTTFSIPRLLLFAMRPLGRWSHSPQVQRLSRYIANHGRGILLDLILSPINIREKIFINDIATS